MPRVIIVSSDDPGDYFEAFGDEYRNDFIAHYVYDRPDFEYLR
jgi:hypothetical protein